MNASIPCKVLGERDDGADIVALMSAEDMPEKERSKLVSLLSHGQPVLAVSKDEPGQVDVSVALFALRRTIDAPKPHDEQWDIQAPFVKEDVATIRAVSTHKEDTIRVVIAFDRGSEVMRSLAREAILRAECIEWSTHQHEYGLWEYAALRFGWIRLAKPVAEG